MGLRRSLRGVFGPGQEGLAVVVGAVCCCVCSVAIVEVTIGVKKKQR